MTDISFAGIQNEVERADCLLRIVSQACDNLLVTADFDTVIRTTLDNIRQVMGVDRVALEEMIAQPDGSSLRRRDSWVMTAEYRPDEQNVKYMLSFHPQLAHWDHAFRHGLHKRVSRATADDDERAFLEMQGVVSLLAVPIILSGAYWGVISLADCRLEREWKARDISLLHTLACMLGSTIVRQRAAEELRAIEEHLREREERYHAIVSNAAMGICLVDEYGQFLECNPAFAQMTGYFPEELAVCTLSQVTNAEDWSREQQQIALLWDGHYTGYSIEKRLITRTGKIEWVLAMTTLIRDSYGSPRYAVQLLENISARKESERLRGEYEEKLRALTLNATLSEERERRRIAQDLHDQIGQSLAIARMRLGQLQPHAADTDPAMRREIEEIRTLLGEALDYSRTVTSELSPPILHELGLVPALKWLARHFSERYHLATELEADASFPQVSQEHRVVFYHIIRELLFNVVKHAQATRAVIRLICEEDAIMLTVEDDGCGLRRESREANTDGFGLFSVRERIEQLRGTFTLQSSPRNGTRCILRMPAGELPREAKGR